MMSRGLKIGLIVGGIVLVVLLILPAVLGGIYGWQDQRWGNWGMMGPGMMGGYGGWWFMPIFMIIFWGLVIWGIVALIRHAASTSGAGKTDSAMELLKQRYAKGEISKEEFEQKKKDIA